MNITDQNKIVAFLRKKDYILLKPIGQGALGKTILLKDEIIDEVFVCKKYSPYYEEHTSIYFKNFVDEIKLLHKLYHSNVVRVYNYYLYAEKNTGYILMEYIEGKDIKSFCFQNPDLVADVFRQTIAGFCHLESNNILHRDIRPENVMVSDNGNVKIIDLGFGKKIEFDEDYEKSISLNWRFTPPADFDNKIYDFGTEVYFVGKLFEEILSELGINNFTYQSILSKMIQFNFENRPESFSQVERLIISKIDYYIEFSEIEKYTYKSFADSLQKVFGNINSLATYQTDISQIQKDLLKIYQSSALEDYIQNPVSLTRVFVKGTYYYNKHTTFHLQTLKDFLEFLKSASPDRQKIIINNLWQRLDSINRYSEDDNDDDDLPF